MSPAKLTRKLALHPRPSACLPGNDFSNSDLDPVPFAFRTWTWYNVGGFWISEGFQIPILQMAGSLIASGLSPGMAMGAIVLGTCLVMVPCALTGYVGARTGCNYPVMNRACWGLQGSKFAVAVRGVVAIFWCGVQFTTGGSCVYQMLKAIWPSLDSRVPNRLPESANITSVNLLCFFIFWLISLPFLYINVSKLRHLFLVKMILMPLGGLALFIWAVVAAKGFGPIFSQPTNAADQGKTVGFVFMAAITSAIGPQATFALNMGDFCRYAKSPRGALWSQVVMMPVCITLTAFLGVTLASASAVVYKLDEPAWNPLDVIAMFDSRAAAFFVSLMFAFATLCTNIAGNTVAFGNDLMAMMPKWVNVRRGQFICAILAVCTTPWNILASSQNFLSFLNGYSVFLGPLCGIMLCDYWVLRRQYLNLEQLYTRHGFYWYTKGWNIRTVAAFLLALIPGLPGLANSVNHVKVPAGFENIYTQNWLVGLVIAGALYYGFSVAFKIDGESLLKDSREDRATEWLLTGTPVLYGVEEVQIEKDQKD